MEFEIRDRDAGARLGRLTIRGRRVETPLFLPVYNPNIPIITVSYTHLTLPTKRIV